MPRRPRAADISVRPVWILRCPGRDDFEDRLQSLPGGEIILPTFNVDALLNFFSGEFRKDEESFYRKIGIPDVLEGRSLDEIKRSDSDWRS